jgi:pyruvate-ferredoxin/flavodoxin oxidoreductase
LDSLRQTIPLSEYRQYESRFQTLLQLLPAEVQRLMEIAQKVVEQKWTTYEGMALYSAEAFHPDARK